MTRQEPAPVPPAVVLAGGVSDASAWIGVPVFVHSFAVSASSDRYMGSPQVLADTEEPNWGTFCIGRIYKLTPFGDSDAFVVFHMVQPNGVIFNSSQVRRIPSEVLQLLQTWEDWEIEQNNDVYGNRLEQAKLGVWELPKQKLPPMRMRNRVPFKLGDIPVGQPIPPWLAPLSLPSFTGDTDE